MFSFFTFLLWPLENVNSLCGTFYSHWTVLVFSNLHVILLLEAINTILLGDRPTFEDNCHPTPSFLLMLTSLSWQALLLWHVCVKKHLSKLRK